MIDHTKSVHFAGKTASLASDAQVNFEKMCWGKPCGAIDDTAKDIKKVISDASDSDKQKLAEMHGKKILDDVKSGASTRGEAANKMKVMIRAGLPMKSEHLHAVADHMITKAADHYNEAKRHTDMAKAANHSGDRKKSIGHYLEGLHHASLGEQAEKDSKEIREAATKAEYREGSGRFSK